MNSLSRLLRRVRFWNAGATPVFGERRLISTNAQIATLLQLEIEIGALCLQCQNAQKDSDELAARLRSEADSTSPQQNKVLRELDDAFGTREWQFIDPILAAASHSIEAGCAMHRTAFRKVHFASSLCAFVRRNLESDPTTIGQCLPRIRKAMDEARSDIERWRLEVETYMEMRVLFAMQQR